MNPIGFSVIINDQKPVKYYIELLERMLDKGCSAIEIHLTVSAGVAFDDARSIFEVVRQFTYRSVHASQLTSPVQKAEISHYKELINRIDAHAMTIHPDGMQQWQWLVDEFGDVVSFENMDREKQFGASAQDMKLVFTDAPSSRWTFDLNHVYSIDSTMQSADLFYGQFKNIGHYHVSGYGGPALPHTTLHDKDQDIILGAIKTPHPIIIESYGTEDIHLFDNELAYVNRFCRAGKN